MVDRMVDSLIHKKNYDIVGTLARLRF